MNESWDLLQYLWIFSLLQPHVHLVHSCSSRAHSTFLQLLVHSVLYRGYVRTGPLFVPCTYYPQVHDHTLVVLLHVLPVLVGIVGHCHVHHPYQGMYCYYSYHQQLQVGHYYVLHPYQRVYQCVLTAFSSRMVVRGAECWVISPTLHKTECTGEC